MANFSVKMDTSNTDRLLKELAQEAEEKKGLVADSAADETQEAEPKKKSKGLSGILRQLFKKK